MSDDYRELAAAIRKKADGYPSGVAYSVLNDIADCLVGTGLGEDSEALRSEARSWEGIAKKWQARAEAAERKVQNDATEHRNHIAELIERADAAEMQRKATSDLLGEAHQTLLSRDRDARTCAEWIASVDNLFHANNADVARSAARRYLDGESEPKAERCNYAGCKRDADAGTVNVNGAWLPACREHSGVDSPALATAPPPPSEAMKRLLTAVDWVNKYGVNASRSSEVNALHNAAREVIAEAYRK